MMEWPPLYSFPPFFTKQMNAEVWQKQKNAWIELLTQFAVYSRRYRFNLNSTDDNTLEKVIGNAKIGRKLKDTVFLEILEEMQNEGKAVIDKGQGVVYILHESLDSLASKVYEWGKGGQISVATFYEIIEEFPLLDDFLLNRITERLEVMNKGVLMEGGGIKFIN